MGLLKIKCPECNAGLKSATGFTPGQTVCCPKCETYFAVEEPAEDEDEDEPKTKTKTGKGKEKDAPAKKAVKAAVADDADDEEEEDEKPKKKKKKRAADDDDERSYKKSPIRFVILGILVLVLIGLGVMLYLKKQREATAEKQREATAEKERQATAEKERQETERAEKERDEKPPAPFVPKNDQKNDQKNDPKVIPKVNPKPDGKGPDAGGFVTGAVGGLLSGGPAAPDREPELRRKYTAALVGVWTADLGNGVTEELTYKADGTFTAKRTGAAPATTSGRYTITSLVGTKGLRIQQDSAAGAVGRTVTAVFEGNELQHPSLEPGVTAVFRKK